MLNKAAQIRFDLRQGNRKNKNCSKFGTLLPFMNLCIRNGEKQTLIFDKTLVHYKK